MFNCLRLIYFKMSNIEQTGTVARRRMIRAGAPISGTKQAKNFASSSRLAKGCYALAKKEIPP